MDMTLSGEWITALFKWYIEREIYFFCAQSLILINLSFLLSLFFFSSHNTHLCTVFFSWKNDHANFTNSLPKLVVMRSDEEKFSLALSSTCHNGLGKNSIIIIKHETEREKKYLYFPMECAWNFLTWH